jgi:hypothetical protein
MTQARSVTATFVTAPLPPTIPTSVFTPGTPIEVTTLLNVRSTASLTGTLLGQQPIGARGTIGAATPVSSGGYVWVYVDFASSPDGWVADVFLKEHVVSAPSNTPPLASHDLYITDADTVLNGVNVLFNDVDVDGDSLQAIAFSAKPGSAGGSFTLTQNGILTFDPGSSFKDLLQSESVVTKVGYTVTDGSSTAVAEAIVTVSGTKEPEVVPNPDAPRELGLTSKRVLNKAKNGRYVEFRLGKQGRQTCTVETFRSLTETDIVNDMNYQYELGLFNFTVDCIELGGTITIEIVLDKKYDTTNWVYRKYNSNTQTYTTISSDLIGYTTENGVTVIRYDVTDGGPLDEDGSVNGSITDPSGPAVANMVEIKANNSRGGGGGGESRTSYSSSQPRERSTSGTSSVTLNTNERITTANLNVRNTANGIKIGTQPLGAQGTQTNMMPVSAAGMTWINIDFATGSDGWVAQQYVRAPNYTSTSTQQQILLLLQEVARLQALLKALYGL